MYEAESKQSATKDVFWSKFEPETKNNRDAVVPGVTAPGNRRPHKPRKMKSNNNKTGHKTTEVKATIPVRSPVKVMNLSADTATITQDLTVESLLENPKKHLSGSKKVSLKDLCAEDKKRVANLIKELAKMGDEKEAVMGQLQTERRQYEKQVVQLVNQQEQILTEREDIQSKLFQCQELLTRYRDQLMEREDQLNTSITEMVNKKEGQRGRSGSVDEISDSKRRSSQRQTENKENQHTGSKELHQRYIEAESTKDRLRRPFTSMIDKEIAKRRLTEDGGLSTIVASESSTTTPPRHGGGGRVEYSDRIPVIQAFRDPIMSSTQKSTDIRAYMDEDSPRGEFHCLEPDASPRSSRASFPSNSPRGQRSSSPIGQQARGNNKVGFKEKLAVGHDELQKHSPQLERDKEGPGNKEFQQKYKKLTPTERKQELLRQRETLLEEQNRLRRILMEQEAQLKRKQDLIDRRRSNQRARMDYLERNGEFPKDPDDDAGSVFSVPDTGSECEGRVERLDLERCFSEEEVHRVGDRQEVHRGVTGATRSAPKAETRAETKIQDKYTRGTSPIRLESEQVDSAPSTPRLIDAATSYSKRLDRSIEEVLEDGILNTPTRKMDAATSYSRRLDRSIEEVVEDGILNTPTRKMDAATSYSRRSPRSPLPDSEFMELPRQNNLPLQVNRQRAPKSPPQRLSSTPGEKTLSVVEIVNSLEEEPTTRPSSLRSPAQRDVTPVRSRPATVGGTAKILSSAGRSCPTGNVFGIPPHKDQFSEELAEETAEESSLLEDIFFL